MAFGRNNIYVVCVWVKFQLLCVSWSLLVSNPIVAGRISAICWFCPPFYEISKSYLLSKVLIFVTWTTRNSFLQLKSSILANFVGCQKSSYFWIKNIALWSCQGKYPYVCIYIYVYWFIYLFISIYMERERERDIHTYKYIYISWIKYISKKGPGYNGNIMEN